MRSMKYGPTSTRDNAGNFIFSEVFMKAYKHNLVDRHEGTEFQFFNGPQGGGLKLIVVSANFKNGTVVARDAGNARL